MLSWHRYADVWKAATQGAAPVKPAGVPIVYSAQYNISFGGLEKLHPFDPCKFKKIVRSLQDSGVVTKVRTDGSHACAGTPS